MADAERATLPELYRVPLAGCHEGGVGSVCSGGLSLEGPKRHGKGFCGVQWPSRPIEVAQVERLPVRFVAVLRGAFPLPPTTSEAGQRRLSPGEWPGRSLRRLQGGRGGL